MSAYTCFADFYDVLTDNVGYDQKADYLLKLFEKHHHSAGLTLDLACGTGTLTIELAKRGIDIFGVDDSADMLSMARQKADEAGVELLLLCQKMQRLELYGGIDTCICTLDSINHLTSKSDVAAVFQRVGKYLNPDGLFVFDANTVYKHEHILGDNCYIYDKENVFCAWQNNYNPKNHKVIITLDFFEPTEPGATQYIRSSEQFSERAYTREELTGMLTEAGLSVEAVYDDMSFDEPDTCSQREIYVVRKI